MRRFLLIQTAFLGDVILATPVLSELKRIYPDARIDIVVRKGNEQLLANNPHLQTLYIWDKKEGKYRSLFKLIKALRKNNYHEIITLQRYSSAALITLFVHSKKKIGFSTSSWSWVYTMTVPHSLQEGQHEVTRNLSTIQHHGAKGLARPKLFPSREDFERVSHLKTKSYFCLAPASVWYTKQLPKVKWIELVDELLGKGNIYLLGAPGDQELCKAIATNREDCTVLAGKLTLLQSAALMRDAQMNYVNDSGPLHIASAMNAPVRAFFCSTVPQFGFGPLSEDSKVIEPASAIPCRPCGNHGHKACPQGHFKCGNEIDIPSFS